MRLALLMLPLLAAPSFAAEWEELLMQGENGPWKKVAEGWIYAADAKLDDKNPKMLKADGKGNVWVNGEKGRLADLITKKNYKDCEVHVEFLIGKGSNAGIKFQACYEIQIIDKPKDAKLSGDSMGGIYPKADLKPKYHHIDEGIPPKLYAAKPAGEWQTLDVVWRSPRVNEKGEKIENAKIVKATLNGQVIHENQELQHPTGNNYVKKEVETGPFMLQADHGPSAFRNVKIREIK